MSTMLRSRNYINLYPFAAHPLCLLLIALAFSSGASAQEEARWYQMEVSIFANEASNLNAEQWPSENLDIAFPRRLQKLRHVSDSIQLSDWSILLPPTIQALPRTTEQQNSAINALANPIPNTPPRKVGPRPLVTADSFTLPDLARDAFLALPVSAHDFSGTNRALARSANYRLLYHKVWRQPVLHDNRDSAIGIVAGRQFGERSELEGSLRFYFNRAEDRVIFEPHIWLNSFAIVNDATTGIALPPLPAALKPATQNLQTSARDNTNQYAATRVLSLHLSREMRSNEFHYIDHPAIGILVQIVPYTPPPPVEVFQDDIDFAEEATTDNATSAPLFQ